MNNKYIFDGSAIKDFVKGVYFRLAVRTIAKRHGLLEERQMQKIEKLPGTLIEAVEELEKDKFICDVLGSHIA